MQRGQDNDPGHKARQGWSQALSRPNLVKRVRGSCSPRALGLIWGGQTCTGRGVASNAERRVMVLVAGRVMVLVAGTGGESRVGRANQGRHPQGGGAAAEPGRLAGVQIWRGGGFLRGEMRSDHEG